MTTQLPFFGRAAELQLLHKAWRAATNPATRTPQIVTFVAETGVGKSRIIQEFYRQLTVSNTWDPDNFWPDDFQSPSTQLRVNPEFPADHIPNGPPKFLWLGMRWHSPDERNVANSLALPTIKEQFIAFNQRITDMRTRLQRILDAGKEEVRKLTTIRGSLSASLKFVPYGDAISTLWEYGEGVGRELLGVKSTPPTLDEQLMTLCHTWFNSTNSTPIIMWIDDVQWIDSEATQFFTALMSTARTKRWPLLLIATSWPMEWNQFSNYFFLKHETARTKHLSNATDTELHDLLHAAFPQLPNDQVKLLVHKAGGNFLTMVENIQELYTTSRFFLHSDTTQALSPTGIENIRQWESHREKRITQRFNQFDEHVRDFLARASHAGLNTQFLHHVLLRCHQIYPDKAFIRDLLDRCQTSFAVIMPTTSSLHEFRDRGYFAVAQKYFTKWLAANEHAPIHTSLIAELTERVQSAFDDNGNLCNPQSHPTSLRASPSKEQHLILDLALTLLQPNSSAHVQALVAMISRSAAENAWEKIRTLAHNCDGIHWQSHANSSISWATLRIFSNTLRDAGALVQAKVISQHHLDYCREQHANNNTTDSLRMLSIAFNTLGHMYYISGDFTTALHHFNEDLSITRQIVQDRGSKSDLRDLAITLHAVGNIYQANGQRSIALQHFTESIRISHTLVDTLESPEHLRELSFTLNDIGRIHQLNGDVAAALHHFSESLTISRKLVQTQGMFEDMSALSVYLNNVGNIHQSNGKHEIALAFFTESLTFSRQLVDARGIPQDLRELSATLNNIGRIHQYQGNLDIALQHFTEDLTISRTLSQSRGTLQDLRDLSIALSDVGSTYYLLEKFISALQYLDESLAIRRYFVETRSSPEDQRDLSIALNAVCRVHLACGNHDNAVAYATEALAVAHQARQCAPHIISDADMAYLERCIEELL